MCHLLIRKSVFPAAFVLLSSAAQLFSQEKPPDLAMLSRVPAFEESFDDNSKEWIINNKYLTGWFLSGRYRMVCKNYQGSNGLSYKPVQLDYTKDYEIEADVTILKGTGGLLFYMTDKYDHFRIEITDRSDIYIARNNVTKERIDKLFSVTGTPILNKDTVNRLTVTKAGKIHYFFVNGQLVRVLDNIIPQGSGIGFAAGLNSDIVVDHLRVAYLEAGKQEPVIAAAVEQKEEEKRPVVTENVQAPTEARFIPQLPSPVSAPGSPLTAWVSPSGEKTTLNEYSARVRASVTSDEELASVMFYVNGVGIGEAERRAIPEEPGKYIIEKSLTLSPGQNSVYFLASNSKGVTRSDLRYFVNPEAITPVISWNNPFNTNVIVNSDALTVEACIKSPSGLTSAKIIVNGETLHQDKIFQINNLSECNVVWQKPIILREGDNSIYIIAENSAGTTTSENRVIRFTRETAEKRIALILGNANYGSRPTLKNPANDANLMEGTLRNLGFEVTKQIDVGLNDMKAAIRDFAAKMKSYNVALFYYAGHGIQVEGDNYLLPVDAKLDGKDDVKWEAFNVEDVMDEFEKYPDHINIMILDACRSNPFTSWTRGDEGGFMPLITVSGTITAYATAPGLTAADGEGLNGIYTEELVKQMNIVQPVESVFKNTRINVEKRTNRAQRPQDWNNLNGEFYFKR